MSEYEERNESESANNNVFTGEVICDREEIRRNRKERRRKARRNRRIVSGLVCSLAGGVIGAAAVFFVLGQGGVLKTSTVQIGQNSAAASTSAVSLSYVNTGNVMSASEIYAAYVNSTVGITTSITTNYFGYQTTSAASGSGFILTSDGYIVTNYHVIEDADSITVTLYDGTSYQASLVGYDESNDIAVLKVDAEGLTPVVVGNSDNVLVGDQVYAIGNPLGELTFSLTGGYISALNRSVTLSSGIRMNLMQTDCAINSGNSGGALFNQYGEVIGITNAKYSGSSSSEASIDNIGFAIPMNQVIGEIQSIISTGTITKSSIGASFSDVSTQAQRYGYPAGAVVASIDSGSSAESAGLQQYDIITAVNGTSVSSGENLESLIAGSAAGSQLSLTVYRNGQELTLAVTVEEVTVSALPLTADQDLSNGYNYYNGYGNYGNRPGV